jgi:hypothetical protein
MAKETKAEAGLEKYYGEKFYQGQMDGSLRSALVYAEILSAYIQPQSVVDIGCGRGTWLKAFKEKGASELVGYDGAWNAQEKMIDQSIKFHSVDLNESEFVCAPERFDLAISVEVAEHLKPSSAQSFVRSITCLSDTVLFSAAYSKQGGRNHINEQPHTYWANLFSELDYVPFDLFRPIVWGDAEIPFWYQQNLFLYVKRNSALIEVLQAAGQIAIENTNFMNCIHPELYEGKWRIKTRKLIGELLLRMVGKGRRQ